MIDIDKHFTDLVRLILSVFFVGFIMYPFIRDIWSKESRQMEQDMKGENKTWDFSEIWEYHSLRFARGFFFIILFMIVMKTFFNTEYPWELYVMVFVGTLGSNGVSAFLMYLKNKNGTK